MAEAVSVERVIDALKVLITPRECNHSSSDTDKRNALLNTLQLSVSTLEQKLSNAPEWQGLNLLRKKLLAQTKQLESCFSFPAEPDWRFTIEALVLLLCLKECMIEVSASFIPPKPNPKTPEAAPALNPDTLSISQQKTVQSVFQFVISLGIYPYFLPGIGLPIQQRSEFGALLCTLVACESHCVRSNRLFVSCKSLLEVSQHSSLGSLLLTHHLGDILAGLCQLGYCPTKTKNEQSTVGTLKELTDCERNHCKDLLRDLLDRVYQPLVVRELLILQGGPRQGNRSSTNTGSERAPAPAWLRRLSGQLLSERLMRPNGVQTVVRGILEGVGAEAAASNWKKCDAIARILTSCPQQSLSVEEYYQKVCPQILDLLHIQDPSNQFQKVATETFLSIGQVQPQLAEKHLILPMLEPLLRWIHAPQETLPAPGHTLVAEKELSQCVEDTMKVFVIGNRPSPSLLNWAKQVISAIFSLYCFARQNVSHLRSPCQEILHWYLDKSERESAVTSLAELSGIDKTLPTVPSSFQIKPASHGGAVILPETSKGKGSVSVEEEDDDALYEKVSGEQWRSQCLIELLSSSPSRGLAADFFLFCLKRLTPLSVGEDEAEYGSCLGDNLVDLERRLTLSHAAQEKHLQLLQVLSVLCERLSDSIFTDVLQVVEFISVTLERACASYAISKSSTVASQTLSMAMGLVAAMLGGAVKLTSVDFGHLKKLLPILERVSLMHPEPIIQELARDLRVSIATRCAVQLPSRMCDNKTTAENAMQKQSEQREPTSPAEELKNFQEILDSAQKSDIPTRAAALRSLTRLVEHRHHLVLENKDQILQLFVENLEQKDSFVYLSAIQGVAVLSGDIPERVLSVLLAKYENRVSTESKPQTPETRLKVGEALMRCTKTLGDLVFLYKDCLIHTFLRGSKDPDSSVRASSLSNLGELCQYLQFSLGSVVQEVCSCLSSVVRHDPEVQVRRAAINVIVLLLRGLSERATEILQDVMLDLYRLLKFVVHHDSDSVSVLHAQLGLEELDSIMRAILFPPQKLEKKIVVLP
ncbi:hypothetical protein GDO86_008294 [Hymenochirus boettgeri]|uniref:Transport and Golgi organization protein 6 homolog n=1 Tax=Hymenochirus boettgeri TaxID=247094 RepID=A0A8T2J2E8_9PIPI|nr:hypothetical protein GDO86_008294 [Hymenochirus boettgeri]